jgi:rubredoxin
MTLETERTEPRPLCSRCRKYARYEFLRNLWICPVCMKAIGDEQTVLPKQSLQ